MAEYNAGGNIAGGVKQQLTDLTSKFFNGSAQLHMIAPAVGLTEMPGHENASCGAGNGTLFPVLASVSSCVGPEPVLANDQFEKALKSKCRFLSACRWLASVCQRFQPSMRLPRLWLESERPGGVRGGGGAP